MSTDNVTRRSFLRSSAAGAAAAGAVGILGAPAPIRAAGLSEKLRIGFLGTGGRSNAHLGVVLKMQQEDLPVEAAAVCDVYTRNLDRAAERIQKAVGTEPKRSGDYRQVLHDADVDAVCIVTPDHWHAKMAVEAMQAGKHVYCEKPMTHTIQEAQDVVAAWQKTGKIMQVGVQRTSDGRWRAANEFIRAGRIGKVIQAQTEYYRNSGMGQWRYYKLEPEMTPKNIDWKMFLGTEFDLAPDMPFDRAVFRQWRCYWPFGSGLYTDLFVHRLTQTLLALGVRYPRRVVGGGGIFLEYDGRDVPDTATIVADYDEGLQVLITATMCNAHAIEQCIRGHFGTIRFDLTTDGFEFEPERPQVTRNPDLAPKHVEAVQPDDETYAHWENFLEAIKANDQQACNNPPDLGAAAVTTVTMGAESYRQGQVYEWDVEQGKPVPSGPAYCQMWERTSKARSAPRHVPGWAPVDKDPMYSRQVPDEHQKLEGPWPDADTDPAAR
ncbi:MAG: Gfo/Idh/MocA family protein [Planctomycetota bacterium]|jgi:predicted dehydrogenase